MSNYYTISVNKQYKFYHNKILLLYQQIDNIKHICEKNKLIINKKMFVANKIILLNKQISSTHHYYTNKLIPLYGSLWGVVFDFLENQHDILNIIKCFDKIFPLDCKYKFNNIRVIDPKHLTGVHTIYLDQCEHITDNGLKHLTDVHTINLHGCEQITDNGLKHLTGVHTINLNGSMQITDNALKHLARFI